MEQYSKLTTWLSHPKMVVLTFEQIEKIIGEKLPDSAKKYHSWWGNEKKVTSQQCSAWLDAGWKVDKADLNNRMVRFTRD
jgi:hypothetical protein